MSDPSVHLRIRSMTPADIPAVGSVLTRAFNEVFEAHGYPPPFSHPQDGPGIARWYQQAEPGQAYIAEIRDEIVGAAFLHRREAGASIGPVAVDPRFQRLGLGRRLMQRLLQESASSPSVRLFQDAFNTDSFGLYARLGFRAVEVVPILCLTAKQPLEGGTGNGVRQADSRDLAALDAADEQMTGIRRAPVHEYLIQAGTAFVSEEGGTVSGFLFAYSGRGGVFAGPGAARTDEQLFQLIVAVRRQYGALGLVMRLPGGQTALLQRLLALDFRIASLGTLMVHGEWKPRTCAELLAIFPESL